MDEVEDSVVLEGVEIGDETVRRSVMLEQIRSSVQNSPEEVAHVLAAGSGRVLGEAMSFCIGQKLPERLEDIDGVVKSAILLLSLDEASASNLLRCCRRMSCRR